MPHPIPLDIVRPPNPRPLIVAVNCDHKSKSLENAISWIIEGDAEGIYKLELGPTVLGYMKAKDEGHMGKIYKTDVSLKRKQDHPSEKPKESPLHALDDKSPEEFKKLNRSCLSTSFGSEGNAHADAPIQLKVSLSYQQLRGFVFSDRVFSV